MSDFEGKVVIVTGSSSGIGKSAALLFAQRGAAVIIHGQSAERLEQTRQLLKDNNIPTERIHSILGPIEDDSIIQRLIDETVQKFGRLDVLVNNAGITSVPNEDPNSIQTLSKVFAINARAPFCLSKLAIPHLLKTKGCIVNISSVVGSRSIGLELPYEMSKAALNQFTKCSAVQLAAEGVRVNAILCGLVPTNIFHSIGITPNSYARAFDPYVKTNVPMRRYGESKEIAELIVFLASSAASYITGACVAADGGALAGWNVMQLGGSDDQ